MSRPASMFVLVLVLAAAVVAVALGKAAKVEAADPHRIAYLHVSGLGSNARAWYFSGPPTGTLVQDALDKFASEGYHFAALASSVGAQQAAIATSSGSTVLESSYVIVLER